MVLGKEEKAKEKKVVLYLASVSFMAPIFVGHGNGRH